MTNLAHLNASTDTLTIAAIEGDDQLTERLNEYGFIKGLSIQLLKRMPFGGPIIVAANNTYIALRVEEAERVIIEEGNSK